MPNLENFSIKEIKSIVDCLCYLEFSTRDNGIDEINDAIRAALIKVREWIDDRTMNEYFFDINNQKQNDWVHFFKKRPTMSLAPVLMTVSDPDQAAFLVFSMVQS